MTEDPHTPEDKGKGDLARSGRFLGGMGMVAVPVVGLVLIGLIPGLWFFLIFALPYLAVSILAAPFLIRAAGLSVGLGVLTGCAIGGAVFCVIGYYLWLPAIIGD